MEIIISKIKNKNLYYGYLDPRPYFISSFGIYITDDDKGFNDLLAFARMIKKEYLLKRVKIKFCREIISTYDNDIINDLDPPF